MTLMGGIGAGYLLSAGSHALTVSDAVRRFRSRPTPSQTPSPTALASASPASGASPSAAPTTRGSSSPSSPGKASPSRPEATPGVYVYDTTGYEQTDALNGSRHDYPSRTTISMGLGGCHYLYRWQPLQERWDESDACRTSAGVVLRRFSMYHEFFHRGMEDDFACGPDALVMPWHQSVGASWSFRCRSSNTTLDMAIRIIDLSPVVVGGRSIRAAHLRYEAHVSGADEGTLIQDRWVERTTGLFLRITSDGDVQTPTPFGRAHYTEHYRIDLTSMEPQH